MELLGQLLPSPRTSDTNGTGRHGDGGPDLRTAVTEIPLLPTPQTVDVSDTDTAKELRTGAGGVLRTLGDHGPNLRDVVPLLPTPAVNDMGAAYTPEEWDAWTEEMKARHSNGNGHGKSLNVEAQRLLPTPAARDHKDTEVRREPHRPDDTDTLSRALTDVLLPTPRATDGAKGGPNQRGSSGDLMLPSAVSTLLPTPTAQDSAQSGGGYNGQSNVTLTDATVRQPGRWGEYEPAIRRWEDVLGRPAPDPTKPNAKGRPKLSDEFDEWLMGLPAGWITGVPGVTWNETLKACGNGVVRQQAAAALVWLRDVAAPWLQAVPR